MALARALANEPRLILADEPTGNLDTATGRDVVRLVRGLNTRGHTVVLITHDDEIAGPARRVVRLRDGRVVADETRDVEADRGDPVRSSPPAPADDHG